MLAACLCIALAALPTVVRGPQDANQDPPPLQAFLAQLEAVHAAGTRFEGTTTEGLPENLPGLTALLAEYDTLPTAARSALARDPAAFKLTWLCRSFADKERSLEIAEERFGIVAREFGDDAELTQLAKLDVGMHHAWRGDPATALALLDAAREALDAADPARHPIVECDRTRARLRRTLGRPEEAVEIYRTVVDRSRQAGPYPQNAMLSHDLFELLSLEFELGNLEKARALGEERLAMFEAVLPPDDSKTLLAMRRLAQVMSWQRDAAGAIALNRKIHDTLRQQTPADGEALIVAMLELGAALSNGGKYEEALAYQEEARDAALGTGPDHPLLARLAHDIAVTLIRLDRYQEACPLLEQALEAMTEAQTPAIQLLLLRNNYANALAQCGRNAEAVAMGEAAREGLTQAFGPDNMLVRTNLIMLAGLYHDLGRWGEGAEAAIAYGKIARQMVSGTALSLRPTIELASEEAEILNILLSLALHAPESARRSGDCDTVLEQSILTMECMRGAPLAIARRSAQRRAAIASGSEQLRAELAEAIAAVERAQNDNFELERAVRERDRIERRILAEAPSADVDRARVAFEDLVDALPPRSAAVSVVVHYLRQPNEGAPGVTMVKTVTAVVLRPDGSVAIAPIGDHESVTEWVSQTGPDFRRRLRERLLDPILTTAGDIDTLYLSADNLYLSTPLDCLPGENGAALGATVRIHRLDSLFELLGPTHSKLGDNPIFLGLGGVAYDAAPDAGKFEANPTLSIGDPQGLRGARPDTFPALASTLGEIESIAQQFQRTFDAEVRLLTGGRATEAALIDGSRGATFVHLATHGYFDQKDGDGWEAELSPYLLCGLALAGANRAAKDGLDPGIVTAEEVQNLDLWNCYLAVLSACDSSIGAKRGRLGAASMHRAFHGAGARFVVSSLWKVGDANTRRLMDDFYANLWTKGLSPHEALWAAKEAAQKRGTPFRDWAAWIVTGH